eukprot:TRINITY_DN9120_c0_g1_i1.p1 TRINITY_DN9120_c0_g1~~TRINITY_DN9120_c0_g1_i1.p1  ORF type:complete len:363 (+),score=54.83 TRINITY_DN9120_c0_g1_i1:308-1396(+)
MRMCWPCQDRPKWPLTNTALFDSFRSTMLCSFRSRAHLNLGCLNSLNIKFIINLQEAFEHASCGQGILPSSGFSYDPELFMQSGISCGNFPWVDFGSPTISYALDIVQVMAGVVQDGGRVAVHCHAGRGRTGLIIACYLIYADGLTAAQAIHLVRQKRPKTIQTRNQVKFVQAFAAWIDPALRPLDARLQMEATPLTLDQVLENQKPYLHGEELKRFRHIPQLVVECVECTIVKLKEEPEFNLATPPADLIEDFEQLSGYINARAFQQLGRYSASTLCLFLLSWLQHLAEPVIDPSQKYMEHTPSTVATIGCCHRLVQAAKEHRSKSIAKEIAQRLTESLIQVQDEDEGSWLQAMLMSQSDS